MSSYSIVSLALGSLLAGAPAPPSTPGAVITVGGRAPAPPRDGLPALVGAVAVDLDALPLAQSERHDAQYGKKRTFLGAPLEALIERAAPAAALDLALLHFANGMVVPLPFRDQAVMGRLRPFVARGVRVAGKLARGRFEPVARQAGEYVDAPVVHFAGNKVVVAEAWHPEVTAPAARFSPWAGVDTLVAVELAEARAYYAQFDAGPAHRDGLARFRANCQFCHGVRKVGARFGWDFVQPLPMYQWRPSGKQLFLHVKYRRQDAGERAQLMPALAHMTEGDAAALWSWMKAVATGPTAGSPPR